MCKKISKKFPCTQSRLLYLLAYKIKNHAYSFYH